MGEQENLSPSLPQCPKTDNREGWGAYWKSQGQPWRTEPEISAERQEFLVNRLTIVPNIEQDIYPFKDIKLSRADVEYLLKIHKDKYGPVAFVIGEPAKGLDLRGADLHYIDLSRLPLTQLRCGLRSADWFCSTKEQREAAATRMEGANLNRTDLEYATLRSAHLEGTDLRYAHLEGAHLNAAHLEGNCELVLPADLRHVSFNNETNLEEIILGNKEYGFAQLADINWGGVNLAVVDWTRVKLLGDEYKARQGKTRNGEVKDKATRLNEHRTAVRANRQLVSVLRDQGLNEEADYFAHRAQKLQRVVLRLQRKFGRYLFSGFLEMLAGYGYRPLRSIFWYLIIIFGFALGYYVFGHLSLFPPDAFVYSLTSFHGRGFFPGLEHETSLHDPLIMLAAIEAIVGLLIEISFIATFTQRFFGR